MTKGRLEAFSDGVIAIIITITILLIDVPDGNDWAALRDKLPLILVYTVSFVMIGTNWANHHHLLQVTQTVDGKIIWANLFYLFTLSFYPVATGWVGKSNFAAIPTTVYVGINLIESAAYILLQHVIMVSQDCEQLQNTIRGSHKEQFTILLEVAALVCSFITPIRFMAYVLLVAMTLLWIVPDIRLRRIYMESNREEEM